VARATACPAAVTSRCPSGILAGIDDFLEVLHMLRSIRLPSLVLILSAVGVLALIGWGGFSIFADSPDVARFSW
jgi:hypothetical protein